MISTITPVRAISAHLYELRVQVRSGADVHALTTGGFDVLEARGPDYLLVQGDDAVVAALHQQGFLVTIDHELLSQPAIRPSTTAGGYRTVSEQYRHLDDDVVAHPDLAVATSYGVSWLKLHDGSMGWDLRAICITKRRPGDCALNPNTDKPRFLLIAALHARELTTAELAYRWIDSLIDGYGVDADITALVDTSELWVVPIANPDGHLIVEQGGMTPYMQRKNANSSDGPCSSPPMMGDQYGVDLNRNASFQWGGAGTSALPCDQTYLGRAPASEPEEAALEGLMRSLFRQQRGPNLQDQAPETTSGALLTLHSFGDLVLLPWNWQNCGGGPCSAPQQAPNDRSLRALAFRLSAYNGFTTGQASEVLYPASGTTDDWAYGTLGIAGFTFEVGPQTGVCSGFAPPYDCQDSVFWQPNRGALLYAAKASRQPYTLALGPTVLSVTCTAASPDGVAATVQADVDDGTYGSNGAGRPVPQVIAQAEYYLDVPPWAGGIPLAMTPTDGTFDSPQERVSVQITTALPAGTHKVFVRGRNAAGNWGPTTAQWLIIAPPLAARVWLPLLRR